MEDSKLKEAGSVTHPPPKPAGIAVQPGSLVGMERLIVSDVAFNRILGVNLMVPITRILARSGQGDGQVNLPKGIAVDPNTRNIFVVDSFNSRIQKFSPNFVFMKAWGSLGNGDGQFFGPWDITFNRLTGNLLVGDMLNKNIQIFTTDGVFLGEVLFGPILEQ